MANWCQKIKQTCYVVCKSWPQVVQWPININVSSYHVWSRIQLVSSSTKPLLLLGSSKEQFVLQIAKFALEDWLFDLDINESFCLEPKDSRNATSTSFSPSNMAKTCIIDGRLVGIVCTHKSATLITCCTWLSKLLLMVRFWSIRFCNILFSCKNHACKMI